MQGAGWFRLAGVERRASRVPDERVTSRGCRLTYGPCMKLHGYFRSSAAFRVRIALNLKKLDYESVSVHLRRGDQRNAEFLGVNPQGLVPALEDPALNDSGQTLIQSLPIIEYLDETYPEPPLLPRDAGGRARVRAL